MIYDALNHFVKIKLFMVILCLPPITDKIFLFQFPFQKKCQGNRIEYVPRPKDEADPKSAKGRASSSSRARSAKSSAKSNRSKSAKSSRAKSGKKSGKKKKKK